MCLNGKAKPCESECACCHTVLVVGHCEASAPLSYNNLNIYWNILFKKKREINREVLANCHIYLYICFFCFFFFFFFLNFGFFDKSKIDWNEMSCNFVHVFLLIFIFNLTEENFEMICQTCRRTVSRMENTISRKWKPNLQHGHRKVITCMHIPHLFPFFKGE